MMDIGAAAAWVVHRLDLRPVSQRRRARLERQHHVMRLIRSGHTVPEVAQTVGVTRRQVRAIIDRALKAEAAA